MYDKFILTAMLNSKSVDDLIYVLKIHKIELCIILAIIIISVVGMTYYVLVSIVENFKIVNKLQQHLLLVIIMMLTFIVIVSLFKYITYIYFL